ncbi:hypothetical protein MNBD_GAMMA12-2200 [hydrothermal vent metagenome]|uniref:Uncharacterized protein n=1 Tax=hydrothermal vent metagenome TaxID=652676 RepID=A0A3B0YAJ5_9ZZZZ
MTDEKHQGLENGIITGAGIVDKETFMFMVHSDETIKDDQGKSVWGDLAPPVKLIAHNTKNNTWGWLEIANDGFEHGGRGGAFAGGYIQGQKRALVVSRRGEVAYFGFAGVNHREDRIKVIMLGHGPRLLGEHFYVAGSYRRIAKRVASNQWQAFTPDPTRNVENDIMDEYQFTSLDGFNENDIYVCGGQYNLWHFDGQNWTHINATVDWSMNAIHCCAEDGLVYIGGANGEVLAGNIKQGWTEIVGPDAKGENKDIGTIDFIAKYKGTVYMMTYNYFWQLDENNEQVSVRFDGKTVPNSFGYLSVNAGLMMMAGPFDAFVFDGKTWTSLIGGLDRGVRLAGMMIEEHSHQLEQGIDIASNMEDSLDK